MNRLDLTVRGMSCGHCVASVRHALERMDGVTVERVTVGSASVVFDAKLARPEDIVARVADAGYDASLGAA